VEALGITEKREASGNWLPVGTKRLGDRCPYVTFSEKGKKTSQLTPTWHSKEQRTFGMSLNEYGQQRDRGGGGPASPMK